MKRFRLLLRLNVSGRSNSSCARLLGSLVVAVLIGAADVAPGAASQGANYYTDTFQTVNGTRSGVQRLVLTPASNSGVLISERIQSCVFCSTPTMMQTGYVKQGANFTSPDCGSFSGVRLIVEHTPDGVNYVCDLYTAFNNNDRLAVVKLNCQTCGGLWAGYINGSQLEADYIAYNTGYAISVGEWIAGSNTVSGCWGCSGATLWQWTQNNGVDYHTVNPESGQANDGGWSVGHALGSWFQINY